MDQLIETARRFLGSAAVQAILKDFANRSIEALIAFLQDIIDKRNGGGTLQAA